MKTVMRILNLTLLTSLTLLSACKPPPSDDTATGHMFRDGPDAPPQPIDSPDSEAAFWANGSQGTGGVETRIIYGQAGKAPLIALKCLVDDTVRPNEARIQITRLSPADTGAKAFFALVGNSHVARIPVDATEITGGHVWQGSILADDPDLAALTGPREITATLPGAGMVTLQPSERPAQLVNLCRMLAAPLPIDDAEIIAEPKTLLDHTSEPSFSISENNGAP